MTRTLREIIKDFDDFSQKFNYFSAIIIGYDDQTVYVSDFTRDPIEELEGHIENGGSLMEFFGAMIDYDGEYQFSIVFLEEFRDQTWVHYYLNHLGTDIMQNLIKQIKKENPNAKINMNLKEM